MSKLINHLELYRLPWNLADNGISWLEPTAHCNLACDGCYRENRVDHKTYDQTLKELDVFSRLRRSDALSIAGGDPLLYPDLLRTVEEARRRGYKPVVNTNGQALTRERAKELAEAGLAGFTFHVDSKQGRAGRWRNKTELELNELRVALAEIAAEVDVSCAFNATIYPDTLDQVPALTKWAEDHMDKVHVMVFILYRDMRATAFRYYSGEQEVKLDTPVEELVTMPTNGVDRKRSDRTDTIYNLDAEKSYQNYVSADDVVGALRREFPDFKPAAYLNGTEDPTSFQWLLSGRLGRPGKTFGYVGPKFMEAIQSVHHLFTDRYLAYAPAAATRMAKGALALGAIDPATRTIAKNYLRDAITSPFDAVAKPLHFQSVLIIQPIDMLADGRTNMCDGCPDITVWNDRLVWSCRMDEQEKFGRNLWAKPRDAAAEAR